MEYTKAVISYQLSVISKNLKPITDYSALGGLPITFIPLLLFLLSTPAFSQDIYLKLTTGQRKKMTLAIIDFNAPTQLKEVGIRMKNIIHNDLVFSLYFNIIEPDTSLAVDNFPAWFAHGVSALITGTLIIKKDTVINIKIYDVFTRHRIMNKRYNICLSPRLFIGSMTRKVCHYIADDIISALTGEKGINQTKIVFPVKRGDAKELAVIDYDGCGFKQLTRTGSLNLFPTWHPDNRNIAFSSYRRDNLYTFSYELGTGKIAPLSTQKGLNSTPAWSPDGKELALTLTKAGNAEIYILKGRVLRRITVNWAIDTSPAWSPTGRELAFVSDRAGSPQIYIMAKDGTNVRRLTYSGNYNTSPVWSPKGDRIAYVAREQDGLHQIYTILINGENDGPLTWRGNNENPSWSPDGLHLCFASNRNGSVELFVMHWDGSGQKKIAHFYNGCFDPTWSSH